MQTQTRKHKRILVLDVGGTHVKMRLGGSRTVRVFESGLKMTPRKMIEQVRKLSADWRYEVVSIGYPGAVLHGKPVAEPHNLADGWVGFNFGKALGKPVRLVNDAAMQAIGSYAGGRMLFLGLGTGLGSALIVEGILEPTELAHLPYKHGRTYEDYVGERGRKRLGSKKWRKTVLDIVARLSAALEVDYTVIGGGNAARLRKLSKLPKHTRLGSNRNAFIGGIRLWEEHPPVKLIGS